MSRGTLKAGRHVLTPGDRPAIMGIVNVTPDSFSDGGRFFDTARAVEHGLALVESGAHILDIGGESTRPYAESVSEDQELARVIPVIEKLAGAVSVPISIDTTKSGVARRALAAGASMVNDISALRQDPQLVNVVAETGASVVLMHMQGTPRTMQKAPQYTDVVAEVTAFLADAVDRAVAAGVDRSAVLVDPGIGFGKTVQHNLLLIRNLSALRSLSVPVVLGASRKSFMRLVMAKNRPQGWEPDLWELEAGTAAISALAVEFGADIVRVHDVAGTRAALDLAVALRDCEARG